MTIGDLIEHPEGGRFREVFRSSTRVIITAGTDRSALTHIYFQLKTDEHSRFHRVKSDEVWNLYQGPGLELLLWDDDAEELTTIELSATNQTYCAVVRAGLWQAARPLAGDILVGCSVAPGFEFEDFELIQPESEVARRILSADAGLKALIGSVSPVA